MFLFCSLFFSSPCAAIVSGLLSGSPACFLLQLFQWSTQKLINKKCALVFFFFFNTLGWVVTPPDLPPLFFFKLYLFIYFWLCWVFVSVRGLSLVAASGGHSSSQCAGLSLSRPLLLRSTRSRRAGSVVVVHGFSCSVACGIFPDQGSNLCPLHWQADS